MFFVRNMPSSNPVLGTIERFLLGVVRYSGLPSGGPPRSQLTKSQLQGRAREELLMCVVSWLLVDSRQLPLPDSDMTSVLTHSDLENIPANRE